MSYVSIKISIIGTHKSIEHNVGIVGRFSEENMAKVLQKVGHLVTLCWRRLALSTRVEQLAAVHRSSVPLQWHHYMPSPVGINGSGRLG